MKTIDKIKEFVKKPLIKYGAISVLTLGTSNNSFGQQNIYHINGGAFKDKPAKIVLKDDNGDGKTDEYDIWMKFEDKINKTTFRDIDFDEKLDSAISKAYFFGENTIKNMYKEGNKDKFGKAIGLYFLIENIQRLNNSPGTIYLRKCNIGDFKEELEDYLK